MSNVWADSGFFLDSLDRAEVGEEFEVLVFSSDQGVTVEGRSFQADAAPAHSEAIILTGFALGGPLATASGVGGSAGRLHGHEVGPDDPAQ